MTTKKTRNKCKESGFTIMELMVTLVLTLIVLSAAFALLRGSISSANTNFETTTAQQNMRNAQEFITRELLTAGDGLQGINFIWIPTSFATQMLTSRSTASMDPGAAGYISPGAIISDDDVPAGTAVTHGATAMDIVHRWTV